MGEIPGFSSSHEDDFDEKKRFEDEAFLEAGYTPEVIISSTVGVYTLWSKINGDKEAKSESQDG